MRWIFRYFKTLLIFFAEISFVEWYSYKTKRFLLLNASYLLNAPSWTHKVKKTLQVFIKSFTVCIYLSSSAQFPRAGGLGPCGPLAEPLLNFSVSKYIQLFPYSTLAIMLFNEINNKVKNKPIAIHQRKTIEVFFLICSMMDLH